MIFVATQLTTLVVLVSAMCSSVPSTCQCGWATHQVYHKILYILIYTALPGTCPLCMQDCYIVIPVMVYLKACR